MIAIVLGTRAELIKSFPVIWELNKRKIPYELIHTGQHNLGDLCDKFKIKRPDLIVTKEPKKSSKFYSKIGKALFWNLIIVFKLWNLVRKRKYSHVIYHGDTMTTASIAFASSGLLNPLRKYKAVHLEAGLRSESLLEPFPEEISRKIADRFSDILLAVSDRSEENLKKARLKGKIFNVGNTVVDSALIAVDLAEKAKLKPLRKGKFGLISIHRHENIKNKKRLSKIVDILCEVKMPSYFSLHDNTKKKLIDYGLYEKLKSNKNIILLEPLDYVNYSYQIKNCSMLITDGGSIQEESLIFKKPCVLLRKFTERQEGLSTGLNFLTKLDFDYSVEKIRLIEEGKIKIKKFKNPYGEKNISKKIVEVLLNEN